MNWLLAGNGETDPSQHFFGTTDEKPVNIKTNGVERVTVTASGNVGIGVHEPRTMLHAWGRIATGLDHQSAGAVTFFPPQGTGWFHIDNAPVPVVDGGALGRLRISAGVNPGDAEFVSVTADGRVGIGTHSLQAKFTIEVGELDDSVWGTAAFHRQAIGNNWSHIHWGTTGDWYIRSAADNGNVILQDIPGKVGIGTATPEYKLDVAGIIHADDVVITSDARLKTNVTQLSGVLEKLAHIRGVSFDWNEIVPSPRYSPGRKGIGIIAQELETVYPELVTSAGADDCRAIDYAKLSAILVEAIKELKSNTDMRLNLLESELAAQRAEIARLGGREHPQ